MTASTRRRSFRWLRLFAYVALLSAISGWWLLQRASAAMGERSLEVGRELEKLKELMAGTTTMELNGERLTLTFADGTREATAGGAPSAPAPSKVRAAKPSGGQGSLL